MADEVFKEETLIIEKPQADNCVYLLSNLQF